MKRLNLLFIYTDQQRFDTLAAYGNDKIRMPNLNALAERSIVFEKTYVTQPVCTPSRSTLLTGQWPHTNGCLHNNIALKSGTRCFPEMLSEEYSCAHYGKWHLGDEIYAQHGFTEWLATEDMYRSHYSPSRDRKDKSHYWRWLQEKGVKIDDEKGPGRLESNLLSEELTKPGYLEEVSSDFIRRHSDKPFTLFINFLQPHTPYSTCYDDKYDPADVDLPQSFDNPSLNTLKERIRAAMYAAGHGGDPESGGDEESWRKCIAKYWGSCTLVDTYVGKILDTLRECGLEENTIIVFTSDHGDMMGAHRLLHKSLMYEEAVKVPFLISLPGQREQLRVTQPVSHIDVIPTLLDMLGENAPEELQGESLRPLWETPDAAHEKDVIIEWNPADEQPPFRSGNFPEWLENICSEDEARNAYQASIRTVVTTDGWKFNCSSIGEHELFNLNSDPGEETNLFGDKNYTALIADLKQRINSWQNATGDTVKI